MHKNSLGGMCCLALWPSAKNDVRLNELWLQERGGSTETRLASMKKTRNGHCQSPLNEHLLIFEKTFNMGSLVF